MNYWVLIADIINSKEIKDRGKLQDDLVKYFSRNNKKDNNIVSPYTITLGDEFQAVFKDFNTIVSDTLVFLDKFYPFKFRFAIAYNSISTKINKEQALGMDGPAFYNARKLINNLKKSKNSIINISSSKHSQIYNKSLNLLFQYIAKWKPNTIKILTYMCQNYTIQQISEKINISSRAVYKAINTHNLEEFMGVIKQIETDMNK